MRMVPWCRQTSGSRMEGPWGWGMRQAVFWNHMQTCWNIWRHWFHSRQTKLLPCRFRGSGTVVACFDAASRTKAHDTDRQTAGKFSSTANRLQGDGMRRLGKQGHQRKISADQGRGTAFAALERACFGAFFGFIAEYDGDFGGWYRHDWCDHA